MDGHSASGRAALDDRTPRAAPHHNSVDLGARVWLAEWRTTRALPPSAVPPMTAFEPTWDADRNDPSTWKRVDRGALKAASEHGAFAAYASPIVVELVDSLLGAGRWDRPRRWGLPMGTLPTLGSRCAVPSTGWHLDGSPRVGPADPLVRTFALLASRDHGAG